MTTKFKPVISLRWYKSNTKIMTKTIERNDLVLSTCMPTTIYLSEMVVSDDYCIPLLICTVTIEMDGDACTGFDVREAFS